MLIRGVLFDIDDTLFDSGSEADSVLAYLAMQGLLDRFPDSDAALGLWRELKERHYDRFLNGELTFAEQQRERTRELLARIGASTQAGLSGEEAAAWFAGYQAHRHATRAPFPDAEPALKTLEPDFRLGIVSNSSADHQRRKLDTIGLLSYFGDRIICSDQHGAAKPAVSIFLAGCTMLGLQPQEVAYVGDNFKTDAMGAHQAGLRGIWLDRANDNASVAVHADIGVIHSLNELKGTLVAQNSDLQPEY
ncbi:HAD family hydrolase [Glycomyces tenuis]|uniref:HAD family hydrolase n=1 Tax=Glycomyces tenuis TaxID=58116 RepID=UPI0003F98749|nr:HAD family hydrolase [Glycomyces tenuis]